MTVEKMIAILNLMPKNARVCFFDTWWEAEGWGENANVHAWNDIDIIDYDEENNRVEIY